MFPGATSKLLRVEIAPDGDGSLRHVGIGLDVFNESGQRVCRRGHTLFTHRVNLGLTSTVEDEQRRARIQQLSNELLVLVDAEMRERFELCDTIDRAEPPAKQGERPT